MTDRQADRYRQTQRPEQIFFFLKEEKEEVLKNKAETFFTEKFDAPERFDIFNVENDRK